MNTWDKSIVNDIKVNRNCDWVLYLGLICGDAVNGAVKNICRRGWGGINLLLDFIGVESQETFEIQGRRISSNFHFSPLILFPRVVG